MYARHNLRFLPYVAWALLLTSPLFSDEVATEFLRFHKVGADGGQLQTANVKYTNSDGVEVTLIGAVHIGDTAYYHQLNQKFAEYDALLYELIAPPNQRPQPGQRSSSMIGFLQRGMKRVLGLEFQLDAIDYQKDNFVHADMDPQEFRRAQQERGEGFLDMFVKLWLQTMEDQLSGKGTAGGIDPNELVRALMSDDIQRSLKMLLAGEMQNLEALMAGINDDNGESVILTERNKVAMKVLQREMKQHKKLGIFYGAAHLPDMEERLQQMGFRRTDHEWVTAWNMPPTKGGASPSQQNPAAPKKAKPKAEKPTADKKRERF